MFHQNQPQDVIIIGGGLAGLTTAVYLPRAGRQVTVLEKEHHLGGRAATREQDGFLFNQGHTPSTQPAKVCPYSAS